MDSLGLVSDHSQWNICNTKCSMTWLTSAFTGENKPLSLAYSLPPNKAKTKTKKWSITLQARVHPLLQIVSIHQNNHDVTHLTILTLGSLAAFEYIISIFLLSPEGSSSASFNPFIKQSALTWLPLAIFFETYFWEGFSDLVTMTSFSKRSVSYVTFEMWTTLEKSRAWCTASTHWKLWRIYIWKGICTSEMIYTICFISIRNIFLYFSKHYQ